MINKIIADGITFDDILLIPRYSEITPKDINVSTQLTKNIRLNIPLLSAAMDTVTEAPLAIGLARQGGLGVIHKNMTPDRQALEVDKVKRSANGVIEDPITIASTDTIGTVRKVMRKANIGGVPVVDNNKLVGIVTNRDLRFHETETTPVSEVMSTRLVTAPVGTTLEEAKSILHKNKVEKLLLIDRDKRLAGLITMKDINMLQEYPNAARDNRGRLRVGAAVGVFDYERVELLIKTGVDVIVVDTAHGHSKNVLETIKQIKRNFEIDLIAGNIATTEAARDLIRAGADALKVGIGPGSICTTRIVAGVGVPQISAIQNVCAVAMEQGIPVISDGGVRHSGDITKAIASGASAVMCGSLFAGLDESPGEVVIYKGRSFKSYRGMGSEGAMVSGSADRYNQEDQRRTGKFVPEGIEGLVPYKGRLSEFVYQLVGGLKAGMGYSGTKTIEELRNEGRFIRISGASLVESHPHDIHITREAPNYSMNTRREDD